MNGRAGPDNDESIVLRLSDRLGVDPRVALAVNP